MTGSIQQCEKYVRNQSNQRAGWSTASPDEGNVYSDMDSFLRSALSTGHGLGPLLSTAGGLVVRLFPTWLYNLIWR